MSKEFAGKFNLLMIIFTFYSCLFQNLLVHLLSLATSYIKNINRPIEYNLSMTHNHHHHHHLYMPGGGKWFCPVFYQSTSWFIPSASPVTSRLTSSFTCQLISIIITTLVIHHSFTLSLQAQNLPFQQSFPP